MKKKSRALHANTVTDSTKHSPHNLTKCKYDTFFRCKLLPLLRLTSRILSAILIIIGVWLSFVRKDKHPRSTIGTVKTASCNKTGYANMFVCDLIVTYVVENKKHESKLVVASRRKYTSDSKIYIRYDPASPNNITISTSPFWIGMLLLMIGSMILVYTTY